MRKPCNCIVGQLDLVCFSPSDIAAMLKTVLCQLFINRSIMDIGDSLSAVPTEREKNHASVFSSSQCDYAGLSHVAHYMHGPHLGESLPYGMSMPPVVQTTRICAARRDNSRSRTAIMATELPALSNQLCTTGGRSFTLYTTGFRPDTAGGTSP